MKQRYDNTRSRLLINGGLAKFPEKSKRFNASLLQFRVASNTGEIIFQQLAGSLTPGVCRQDVGTVTLRGIVMGIAEATGWWR